MNITEQEDLAGHSNTTKRKASDPSDANKKQKKAEARFYETDVSNTTERKCDECNEDTLHKSCDYCAYFNCKTCLDLLDDSEFVLGYHPHLTGFAMPKDKDKPTHWFCTKCRHRAGNMLDDYKAIGRGHYKKGNNVTCTDSKCTVTGKVLGSKGDNVLVEVAEVVKGKEESIMGLKVFDEEEITKIR